MFELHVDGDLPLTVVGTGAVGTYPVEPRFILDLHTDNEDLRLYFRDPEPLRLLRRAILALLRQAARPTDSVISVAFSRPRPPRACQTAIDFTLLDELPY